jgi:hypothetical protein
VSDFLEPRIVEKPFAKRWVLAALDLLVRSPFRFGILIAALGFLDTTFLRWAQGVLIPRIEMRWLGMLILPFVWALASALARGTDDPRQGSRALAGFTRLRLWAGILYAGAFLVLLTWAVFAFFDWLTPSGLLSSETHISHAGQFQAWIVAASIFVYSAFGPCFLPLLVLTPGLSAPEARRLSLRAAQINDSKAFDLLVMRLLLVALPLSLVPAYGLTGAAWVVFMGALNYVAYRDIFERLCGNRPLEAAPATPAMRAAPSSR